MSETLYYVRKSNYPIRKAIVSYSQIEVNPFIGKQMYKDRLLMFVLPDKDGKKSHGKNQERERSILVLLGLRMFLFIMKNRKFIVRQ